MQPHKKDGSYKHYTAIARTHDGGETVIFTKYTNDWIAFNYECRRRIPCDILCIYAEEDVFERYAL